MSDDNLRIGLVTATPVVGRPEREATLTNAGPGTVYYKASASVSSTSNDGSLAPGASLSFKDPRWFISSGKRARAYVTYIPEATTDMATQAEFDDLAEQLEEKIAVGTGYLPWVDPYDKGYDPIAADNTEAINDAIDALPEGEGGAVLIPRGPIFCEGELSSMTKRKGIILVGQATPLPTTFDDEEWPTSTLMYTGAGERFIDARSCHGPRLQNIGVGYSNNAFEGILIDFSHNGGSDASVPQVIGCMIQGVGRVGSTYQSSAKALIALNQAISGQILGNRFHHAQTAIRLQEAGTYSNAHLIQGNMFGHCYGYVANPGQGCTVNANTFEGLQGANIDYPHHAVFCDLPGGGSVTGVTISGNWMGDAFGEQEWIRLKPLAGSIIEGNFISGGLGGIRFFNNEESSIVGSGVGIRNNNCSTPKGYGIDLEDEGEGGAIIWEGLEISGNGLGASFAEGPILHIPTGSPDRDVSILSNFFGNPPPVVQPYFLTHASKFTIVGGFAVSGDIVHTGTKVGFNGATPVAKASALTTISGEAIDETYGSQEKKVLENLKKRSEEVETILKNLGLAK